MNAHTNKYETAIRYYDKALEIKPKHEAVLNNRGVAQIRLGDCKQVEGNDTEAEEYYNIAIKDYQEALERAPHFKGILVPRIKELKEKLQTLSSNKGTTP